MPIRLVPKAIDEILVDIFKPFVNVLIFLFQEFLVSAAIALIFIFNWFFCKVKIEFEGDFNLKLPACFFGDHHGLVSPFIVQAKFLWWRVLVNPRYFPINLVKASYLKNPYLRLLGTFGWCLPVPALHDNTVERNLLRGEDLIIAKKGREQTKILALQALKEKRLVVDYIEGTRTVDEINPDQVRWGAAEFVLETVANLYLFAERGTETLGGKREGWQIFEKRELNLLIRKIHFRWLKRREVKIFGCQFDENQLEQLRDEYNSAETNADKNAIKQRLMSACAEKIAEMSRRAA